MKNCLFKTFAAAGLVFATSCSEDVNNNPTLQGGEVEATFALQAFDGIATRAIGDGGAVTEVECAVFDAAGNEMTALRQSLEITNKTAEYSVRLVKGLEYRIAFFAHRAANNYYDVDDMKNITLNTSVASNLEGRDAFTNYIDITAEKSMAAIDTTVCLYRPFAQLNIGSTTADTLAAHAAGVVVAQSKVKVSNVYTAFNAYENTVAGDPTTMQFRFNNFRVEPLQADGESYAYLALNYLLVGDKNEEKSLSDVEFIWRNEDGSKSNEEIPTVFHNIPVQRNYRTNIIGWILTNPAQFNITISPDFLTPDYNLNEEGNVLVP